MQSAHGALRWHCAIDISSTCVDLAPTSLQLLGMHALTGCDATSQGRPVNVKHDARCVMGKVGGGRQKTQTGGDFKNIT